MKQFMMGGVMLLASVALGLADAPTGPQVAKTCSPNAKHCGTFDPLADVTRIADVGGQKGSWTVPGRPDALLISNSGKIAVRIPVTANILPLEAGGGTVVLAFYRPGQPPSSITLAQVVSDPTNLPRTVSGVHWASTYGFEADGQFVLETSQGVRFRIDTETGKPLNRQFFK